MVNVQIPVTEFNLASRGGYEPTHRGCIAGSLNRVSVSSVPGESGLISVGKAKGGAR